MTTRTALGSTALLTLFVCACSLDRNGIGVAACSDSNSCAPADECIDERCVPRRDAAIADAALDGGADASFDAAVIDATGVDAPPDASAAHCATGVLDGDESDVDCGGSCPACSSCERCATASDCATGDCLDGRCRAELSSIVTPTGATISAFVRDGAVLLAHYAPGTFHREYHPHRSQRMDGSGGSTPPAGWAPDPCRESGHLDFSTVAPTGRVIRLECGSEIALPTTSVSSTLFDSFDFGDYGTVGATGTPGWATISATMSGRGRTSYGSCGVGASGATGGIAYCDGSSTSYANHLVSYTVFTGGGSPYVGCGRTGCNGPSCPTHVWVWADLP